MARLFWVVCLPGFWSLVLASFFLPLLGAFFLKSLARFCHNEKSLWFLQILWSSSLKKIIYSSGPTLFHVKITKCQKYLKCHDLDILKKLKKYFPLEHISSNSQKPNVTFNSLPLLNAWPHGNRLMADHGHETLFHSIPHP